MPIAIHSFAGVGVTRQLGAVLLAGIIGTCQAPPAEHTRVAAQEPQEPQPPAEPPPRLFDLAATDASELVRAARDADDTEALRLVDAGLPGASADEAGLLRWIGAAAASGQGDHARAHAFWQAIAQSDHVLAPLAALRWAEALEDALPSDATPEQVQPALDAIAPAVAADFANQDRARRAQARLQLRAGVEGASDTIRTILRGMSAHIGGASVAMPLAEHLANSDEVAHREEALALFRRVATRAPKANVGRQAAARAEQVLATLPRERREALAAPSVEDRFAEAEALYQSMHHRDAERAYAALARSLEDPLLRCQAELEEGKAMLRRRARREGSAHMHGVAERCTDTDVRAWARYKAGRAYTQIDQRDAALAEFAALVREAPDHRLTDDAYYRAALLELGAGRAEAFVANLTKVVEDLPEGDMVGESYFRLAMHFWDEGQHATSLGWLERALGHGCAEARCEVVAGELMEDLRGRTLYWRARNLGALARPDEATAAYRELARTWPLSYYGQQALMRLSETAPEVRAEVLAEYAAAPAEELRFPWRDEFDAPWMARTIALLRVGETGLAIDELDAAGAIRSGADEDLVWFSAAILARAGALPEVTRIVRRRLRDFRRVMPSGRAHALWRLAYPKAFAPLIEEKAAEADVPAAFVRAIAREESSFDPDVVSWAHAYGLVQVILPTARGHAQGLGRITPARLRDPAINLTVGTRFMRNLRAHFDANPALVPSAYNAGQGALDRWIRQRGDEDMDVFVEHIPYDETRRYTRRVVQTWGIYTYLDETRLPELPRRVR